MILLDPIDPNSAEEMHMREVILSLVSSATDEPTARKALNAITPFIAERSKILESTLQVLSHLSLVFSVWMITMDDVGCQRHDCIIEERSAGTGRG